MTLWKHSVLRPAILSLLAVAIAACGSGDGSGLNDRLIVVRNEGIADLNLATGEETLLVQTPDASLLIEPAISPDGTTIAYVRQLVPIVIPGEPVELGMDLYLADRDGGNQRLLLEHSESNEQIRTPTWFPAGERLLINVQRIIGGRIESTIEILEIATGQRTVVVEDGFRPTLSPDGSRIAYVTQDELILQTLWVANVDGSDPIALAGPDDELGSIISPRFSPDGSTIAFAGSSLPAANIASESTDRYVSASAAIAGRSSAGANFNGLPADIWTVPSDDGELVMLAPLQLDLPSLAWSADGERLFAFAGVGLFVIYPSDGTHERLGDGTFHGQLDWVGVEE